MVESGWVVHVCVEQVQIRVGLGLSRRRGKSEEEKGNVT